MAVVITYVVAVSLFLLVFKYLGISQICKSSYELLRSVRHTMTDSELDDGGKEVAVRSAALRMLHNSFVLLGKVILLIFSVLIPVWLADWIGIATLSQTTNLALRIDVMLLTLLAVSLIIPLVRKHAPNQRKER